MNMDQMFCYQCQETAGCTGCTKVGVCGKSPELANMQDLLIYVTKGLSEVTTRLRNEGKTISKALNHYITLNLFTTITNANFDDDVFYSRVQETLNFKRELIQQLTNKNDLSEAALWDIPSDNTQESIKEILTEKAKACEVGVLATENEDIRSLRELITYGIKGLSAYSKHANALGYDNEEIDSFMQAT